jgi:hypothetical protein
MHPAIKNALGFLLCCCSVALLFSLCEFAAIEHQVKPGIVATAWAFDWWFDCHKNRACLTSDVLGTFKSAEKAAGQSYKASIQVEAAATQGLGFITDFRRDTHSVLAEAQFAIHAIGRLAEETRGQLKALLSDADLAVKSGNQVLLTANETLKPLKTSLDNIDRLTKIAADQLQAGSPLVQQTLQDLKRAIDDFAALLENKNIQATLANVASTSGHLDSSAESIDKALLPWRQKAHLLKTIVSKAWELMEHAIPLLKP